MVLVNFGDGKCPLCGDFGRKMERETFHCTRCNVAFDRFSFSVTGDTKEETNFWN